MANPNLYLNKTRNFTVKELLIAGIVEKYIKTHPQEIKKVKKLQKRVRYSSLNKFQADEVKELRWTLFIPIELYRVLNKYVENFLADNKEVQWFAKTFPIFSIPEKI